MVDEVSVEVGSGVDSGITSGSTGGVIDSGVASGSGSVGGMMGSGESSCVSGKDTITCLMTSVALLPAESSALYLISYVPGVDVSTVASLSDTWTSEFQVDTW